MKFNFIAFILFLLPGLIWVSTAGADTVAYVDARKLIDEAPQGRAAAKLLEEKFAGRSREIKGRIEQFKAEEAEFQKNAVLMSADELEAKRSELIETQRDLQQAQQDYNEEYASSRDQSLQRLEKMISDVIIELAKEEEISLIVQQAVYASSRVDITDQVLARLKEIYGQ